MRIEAFTLRELRLKLRAPFEASFGTISARRILLLEAQADGVTGWGEITAGEGPFYNSETTDTAWTIFRDFVAPSLLGRRLSDATEVPGLLAAIRGHEMTKAAAENALWDIEAQQKGVSLATLLGGVRSEISCGVSLGIQESPEDLLPIMERELEAGYQRIKLKIKPGKDIDFVSAARKRFPSTQIMVDANSAYRIEDAAHLRQFDAYDLMMIEQPLAWDDIFGHAQLQPQLATAICLDESIHHARHAQAAIEIGAGRVINIKLGRVGGHTEARRIEQLCRSKSTPVWCGGMLESGIGRAHNVAMSTLPGFTLPGDVSASKRYWMEDVIEPEVIVSPQGTIRVPDRTGIGYEVRRERIQKLTVREEAFRADRTTKLVS